MAMRCRGGTCRSGGRHTKDKVLATLLLGIIVKGYANAIDDVSASSFSFSAVEKHLPFLDSGLLGTEEYKKATFSTFRYRGGDASSRQKPNQRWTTRQGPVVALMQIASILNAASKWILAAANLLGVYQYREEGAFLVIGCILACFGTEHGLKPLWNQARPLNAPLADPGMPSSHSLASFFVAVAWSQVLSGKRILFFSIAAVVASLRTICGYHTVAQISVGAILGMSLGHEWMAFMWKQCMAKLLRSHPVMKWWIWSIYGIGSVIFIWKFMAKWISHGLLH
eukprot:scaffold6968_cov91-Cylindrotheca_fusiformis.AAC.3